MKRRDQRTMMAIRGLLAEISRLEKDVRRDVSDAEIIQIVKRERSRREEALGFAKQANRADLIEQNEAEAKILASYLPPELTPEEVSAAINEIIAGGAAQMGPIMKALRERFGAQLDGKVASDLVRQAIAKK